MVERAGQEIPHVVVGNGVVDVFASALFGQQPCAVQLLQSLRNGRHLLVQFLGELSDAVFLIEQSLHQLESLWRTQGLKQQGSINQSAF